MTKAKIAYFGFRNAIDMLNIYLQSECIEKYQFELCSKYDRKMVLTSYLEKSYFVAS